MDNFPLKSSALKIRWAEQHILNLQYGIKQFFSTKGIYTTVEEKEPTTGDRLLKIKLVAPIPEEFALMIGDVLANLRSSLDHLAGTLAKLEDPNAKRVFFPFARDLAAFNAREVQRTIDDFPTEARPIFESLKPYRGGNDLLWAINAIRNDDCHNFLLPLGLLGSLSLAQNMIFVKCKIGLIADVPKRLDEGLTISNLGEEGRVLGADHVGGEGDNECNLQVAGSLSFGDVEVVQGADVIHTLCEMHETVVSIFNAFGTKFFPIAAPTATEEVTGQLISPPSAAAESQHSAP